MKHIFLKSSTLKLTKPFGKTLWLALAMLVIGLGMAEAIARNSSFQALFSPPRLGSRHYQLGHKLALLNTEVKKNGPIDCLMFGNSMVDVGFDPDSFRKAYKEKTGRDIRCFNFGIDASSATSAAAVAQILVEDYYPRLLIFGTDARDYALPSNDPDPVAILETPWIRYRTGDFSIEGWLVDHSYLYRYRSHFSRLFRFNVEGTLLSQTTFPFEILPNGSTPLTDVSTYINDPPEPDSESFEFKYYSRIYGTYQMLDENLDALENILEYNESESQVIVVEMPISDGLYYFFGNGKADYNTFVASVSEVADLHQVSFWRTEPLDSIPDDGWSDYSHLNVAGAEIFSKWLGEQVGRLDVQKDAGGLQP